MHRLSFLLAIPVAVLLAVAPMVADNWPEFRGATRDGISREKSLPEKWSLDGQSLAWKAPYGGRSTPVIVGDHLYLENTAGRGATEQERVLCFNADTGKVLWEYKWNMYQSDVPAHRLARASPAVDPVTGNVYVPENPEVSHLELTKASMSLSPERRKSRKFTPEYLYVLRHVNQMTAWQVPRVHAGVLDHNLRPVILQRHDRNTGFIEVSIPTAHVERHGLATRQDLLPSMRKLDNLGT